MQKIHARSILCIQPVSNLHWVEHLTPAQAIFDARFPRSHNRKPYYVGNYILF